MIILVSEPKIIMIGFVKKSMYKFIQYNYSFSHKNPSSNLKREIEVSCTTWITITLIEEVLKIMFKLIGYSGCLSS